MKKQGMSVFLQQNLKTGTLYVTMKSLFSETISATKDIGGTDDDLT